MPLIMGFVRQPLRVIHDFFDARIIWQDWMTVVGPTISLRIDLGPNARLGPGKARLLELIGAEKSISKAAKALGMSYPRALKLVDQLNTQFTSPVIEVHHGGRSGGGAELTLLGQSVLGLYADICANAAEACVAELQALGKHSSN